MECVKKIKYLTLAYLVIPYHVFAAPIIDNPTGGPKMSPKAVESFIYRLQGIVFGVAGIIAVAMLIYSGVLYMTAGGNEERMGKAKAAFKWAAIGLLVVILSFALVQIFVRALGGNVQ